MRKITIFLNMSIFALIAFFIFINPSNSIEVEMKNNEVRNLKVQAKAMPDDLFSLDFFEWIGQSDTFLKERFGEPLRKDPSAYDYEWWIYKNDHSQYLQFAILDHKIVSAFATGDDVDLNLIKIGQSYDELNKRFHFKDELIFDGALSSYTFRLTEEDLTMRPLVKLEDGNFMQLYFDTFTKRLSSVRILTGDTLLMHRAYEIVYRGDLPEQPNLSQNQWKEIEEGMEKQIFDITNIIRVREGVPPVKWEDSVREVAYNHSKDMAENNYFSHFGLNGDGLKERLAKKEVFYISAGENIAAQFTDAPATMEGWLNSKSHRDALLNDEYTHIGVGVYRLYYTQNFLSQEL